MPNQSREKVNLSCDSSGAILAIPESIVEEAQPPKPVSKNFGLGAMFMFLTITLISISHFIVKCLSISSPYLTVFDVTLYMGVYGTVINFYLGWKNGVNLNPLSYGPKVTIALLLRCTFGLLNNYCTYRSVQLIPLSKSIIIFSLNPFCCAILGSIFLGEHVNKTTTFCIFGACIGIYLLTINKQESEVQDGSLLGYFLVILSTWLSAGIFICLRYISRYNVKMQVPSFMSGLTFLCEGAIYWIFFDDLITISQYKTIDGICMNAIGLMSVLWIACMFYANKYAITGHVAPIMNIENLYTILIDVFYFQYVFVLTDILGIIVLVACIVTPIAFKLIEDKNSSIK